MRWIPLLLGTLLMYPQQQVTIFEQTGDVQWDEPTYDAGGFSYRIVADDFSVPFEAQITQFHVEGDFPAERGTPVLNLRILVYRDANGLPGELVFEQSYISYQLANEDAFLPVDGLVLPPGNYWLAFYERFTGNVNLPAAHAWRGSEGVTFGQDYVISEGAGVGPNTWEYSQNVFGVPGRLFFDVQAIPIEFGTIPPPNFITEQDVWIDENGQINVWCPNPNADGFVQAETAQLGYVFNLVQDCVILDTVTATPSVYPQVFKFQHPIPNGPYTVEIGRVLGFNFKRPSTGQFKVIQGPSIGVGSNFPTNYLEVDRWLLHIPKVGGGFRARLVLNNRFADLPTTMNVVGFDAQGKVIDGTQKSILVIGQLVEIPVYQERDDGVFEPQYLDKISHIGLIEPNEQSFLKASLIYSSTQPQALTATVEESKLSEANAIGKKFTMEARSSESFWDGIALLNLTSGQGSQIQVSQKRLSDHQTLATTELGLIGPGRKNLHVLSSLFSFQANTYYEISSTNNEPFQVLGLRGTLINEPPLMVKSKVGKVQ